MCNLMNYYRVSHLVITTRSRNKTASHLRNSCMHSMPAPYFQSSTSFWFLYHTNVNLAPHPFFFFLTCDVSCLFLTISVEELRPGNCTFMGSSAYSSLSSAFPANWQLDPEASTDRSFNQGTNVAGHCGFGRTSVDGVTEALVLLPEAAELSWRDKYLSS